MKNKLKIALIFILAFVLALGAVSVSAEDISSVKSWYCIKNKSHKQPVLDGNLSIVEKYGGVGFDKSHGDDKDDKVIYLTFDAGYENGNIEKILDVLKRQNVQGAFFVLGNLIVRNTDLVCRMFDEGHLVCNHTYSHKSMVNLTFEDFKKEIVKLESTCLEHTGHNIAKYYRPPEGKFDESSLQYAQSLGYKTVFWSIAYEDWKNDAQMSEAAAKQKIMANIHNGAIILLHPTSATNAKILEDLICELRGMGYRFGSLDEMQ